jgi:hypothetical protein
MGGWLAGRDVFVRREDTCTRRRSRRSTSERRCAGELWDRGWGKPAMYAEIEGGDPLGMDEVTEAIAKVADELRDKREARAASPT